jgi:Trypsin-like serine proteases, typically periplasmic, contain C-terminal PDZ domain
MTVLLSLFLLMAPAARPGLLGFSFTMHSDSGSQWLVVRVVAPDGPAARAGLASMDVITALDGKPLRFRDDLELLDFLATVHAGQRLRLSVVHGQKKMDRVIQAVVMPNDAYERWLLGHEIALKRRAAGPAQ